jgi:AraC-like DNA-binding protein
MKQIAFTWLLCILSICAYAQQITVTGTVTDAENNPLIGAAVVVVGTTDGVITDFDGKYTIKAASGQSLKFSYVGYREQTVKVDSSLSIAEIGYDCGFNNLSNFNRIFKKKKGVTPKEFRDNYRKNKTII